MCAKHPPSSRVSCHPDYLSTTFVSNAQFSLFLYFRPNGCLQCTAAGMLMAASILHIEIGVFIVHEGRRAKTGFARWLRMDDVSHMTRNSRLPCKPWRMCECTSQWFVAA